MRLPFRRGLQLPDQVSAVSGSRDSHTVLKDRQDWSNLIRYQVSFSSALL